jgi:glycosyltransferase involved in cell wall biosynthesis
MSEQLQKGKETGVVRGNSGKPRALVIAPQPFFSPRGTPFSVYYRTLVLAEAGVEVDLLTYGEGSDVDIPGTRIFRIPRFARPVPIGPSSYKLFLDAFVVLRTLLLLCSRRYDFVHAHEEAVFFCVFLKPVFRFKLVYDMHSSLPQQLSNFKFTKSRLVTGLFRRLEDRAIRVADAVITICPDLRDYVMQRIPRPERHFLIENSIYDPVRLKPSGAAPLSADDSENVAGMLPAGRRLVVYAGTLEPYQGMDILIPAFRRALDSAPDAFLVIVGGTETQAADCRLAAGKEGLAGNFLVHARVSQAAARRCARMASVQVSPRSAGTNTPLKTYEQLDSGIPLVATRIHSHTQVLTDEIAYLADPDPASFSESIVQALRDGTAGNRKARLAREIYRERYARPVYEQKIRSLLKVLGICAE